ncbi:hypothetical protein A2917_01025 [Candidatus Nomurabacteria bacterium RIFCSPLOWO2_01_FULL_42_17]|uniref:POTRA domain-containing protein n=1 Tax=Candidatus Nomurabacteria bacterium RIFCSPLOWO2_01_FULL_42_17 TaxID=1801780 RepID=A0A1F6XMJ0_9BACT|nr:MAG: hypothetical protein A2917_01025 [Candidatus Nomurabacteria bacterium RIFCSPLOWO2_01_FULL_42_17]
MQKRNILNSPRLLELKKKRRRVLLNKILLCVFAFGLIFAASVFASRVSALNITEIEIKGNKVLDSKAIKAVVQETTGGSYLWFFPKTNILYYPKNGIRKELQSKFKGLGDITFSVKERKILEVSVTEREAEYIWCGENISETPIKPENDVCFFVDRDGYVFDPAPYFSNNVYFKLFGPLVGDYFSPEIFDKIVAFKDFLSGVGIKPSALYIKDDGNIEIYLASSIELPNSPKIIFKKDFDFEKLAENLQAALNAEPLKSNMKNKYSSLLYIDLRYGNKVIYKFR